MKRVLKFPVNHGYFTLMLPADAIIMHVAMQRGKAQMWVVVDDSHEKVERQFFVVATGEPLPIGNHVEWAIATFLTEDGTFVWHLFELTEAEA